MATDPAPSSAKADAGDHASGRLVELVLVPAGGMHRLCDGRKPVVTVRGLQPGSHYTVQVRACFFLLLPETTVRSAVEFGSQ